MHELYQENMVSTSSVAASSSWGMMSASSAHQAPLPLTNSNPVRVEEMPSLSHSQRNLQQCSEHHEYTTSYNQNTGISPIAGIMFYASSKFEPITIETMEIDVRTEFVQNYQVLVYTTDESYYIPTSATDDGVYNNPEAWTLVANTTLIPHPNGERALIPTNDFTNIALDSLQKQAFFIKLQGSWIDHTLQALVKDGELAFSGDYMSVFAGSPVNIDFANPSQIFPMNQLDRSANPIFAGKFYFSTPQDCQNDGEQAVPRTMKTTVEFILVTDVQLSAQDYDNIEVDMENLFAELVETDPTVAGLVSNHGLKLAQAKALMRQFNGQCVPEWTQCLALVVQLDLQYLSSINEGDVLAQIYKQSPAIASQIADTLPDSANWFDIGLKGVETAFELTFTGSFAAQKLDDVQLDFLHQGIVDFVGQHVVPQYVQILTMDVQTQTLNGESATRRQLTSASSSSSFLRQRRLQAGSAMTTLTLQGTLMGAQFSLEEPLQFANRIMDAFTEHAEQFVPSMAFNLNLPGPINEGSRTEFFLVLQDIDVFIDVGQERPNDSNDVYDGTIGSGVGSDDPPFQETPEGGESTNSYTDGNLMIIVISVGAAIAVIAICVAGYCLYKTAFKNSNDDDINDGFTKEEIRKREERKKRRAERKAKQAAAAAAAANGEDPTLATSTGHTMDSTMAGRRPATSVATTTGTRSIFSGDTEDEGDYPPGWGSESNDEEEGEQYHNEFIQVEESNNMSSPLTPSPKSKVSKKKAGPPSAPSLVNQSGPPYTIDGLRQLGIGKLVRIANEYNIPHDPTLVVKKEDMVQVMVNSGKLPLVADTAPPTEMEESLPPFTYTLQGLRAMSIHDLRQLLRDLEIDYNSQACVEKEDLIRVLYYCGKITIVRQAPRPQAQQSTVIHQETNPEGATQGNKTSSSSSKSKKNKNKQKKDKGDVKKKKSKSKSKKEKDARKSKHKSDKKVSSSTKKQAARRVSLVAAMGWSRGGDPPEEEPEPVVVYPSTKNSPVKSKKKSVGIDNEASNPSSKRRGSIIAAFGWFRPEQAKSDDELSSSSSDEEEDTFDENAGMVNHSMMQPNSGIPPSQPSVPVHSNGAIRPIPNRPQNQMHQQQAFGSAPPPVRRASVATPGRSMPQNGMTQQQYHIPNGTQQQGFVQNGATVPPTVRRASVATPGRPMMQQQPQPRRMPPGGGVQRQSQPNAQTGQVRRASVATPGRAMPPPIQQRMPPSQQANGVTGGVPLRRISLAAPGRPMPPSQQQNRSIPQGAPAVQQRVPQPQGVPLRRASTTTAGNMAPPKQRNFQQTMMPAQQQPQQQGIAPSRRASVSTGVRVNVPQPQGVPLRRASVSTAGGGMQQQRTQNKPPPMVPVARPKPQAPPSTIVPASPTKTAGTQGTTSSAMMISPLQNDGWSPLKQHPKMRVTAAKQPPAKPTVDIS